MELFRNILVFSLFVYSFALPALAQEEMDLELSRLMEAEHVGESNIRTRELYTMSMINISTIDLGTHNLREFIYDVWQALDCRDNDHNSYSCYRFYDVSFLVDGQQKSLVLVIEESEEHSPSEILREVKAILGKMPKRWLSEVHFIKIKRQMNPNVRQGQFESFISSQLPSWVEERFPQLSPRVIRDRHGFINHIHNAIQVHFHYSSQDRKEEVSDATQTMRHELGHLIARHPESGYSSQEWYDAIVKDDTSAYGGIPDPDDSSDDFLFHIEQDFAETVNIYLTTYRGSYADPYLINSRRAKTDFPHRFAILDRIMGIDEMMNVLNTP